ncbi:hypothetical protein AMTRI_Chr03g52400 [Amborella trichopoda]|uniref:Cyclin n=1 Tax=Amborella trichopoda TaxID=13333 RepID=W1NU03_AMBTC|nr:cyclin-U4-1 [Amborella trichopoda]ERN01092.1 hypothetical protein AMTR_s00002p00190080 [Amborella trichopoda]|eukprot:XP_006838523.1 cyclin-U4-1 [Amborella trichopoda]
MANEEEEVIQKSNGNGKVPRVIRLLSFLLQRVAEKNDERENEGPCFSQKISVFHGICRPAISIESYLERVFKYANCSPSCFVVAYVYLDRFSQRQQTLPITSLSVHRLLITSVLVAAKFMDDLYYNNAYYAKVGGISITEMNCLEVDFLFGLGFHLNVTPTAFNSYCTHLQREMFECIGEYQIQRGLSPPHHCFFADHHDSPSPSPSPSPSHHNNHQLAVCCSHTAV